MNRLIISIFILLVPFQLKGQMYPLSDQYLNNLLAINPAFAGCQNALSATLFYRNQWVGFKDSPKSQGLSVHTPVKNDRIGLGLVIDRSSYGIFRETRIIANYAYRTELHNGKLALGLGFGASFNNMAWNELKATDPNDQQLLNTPVTQVLPNFSFGAYYYTRKYFIGLSLPMLFSHELNSATGKYKTVNLFSEYNYFLTGGLYFDICHGVKVLPSFLLKYQPNHSPQVDFNAQIILRDRIWFGLGYRSSNTIIAMLQYQLNDQLRLSYSYDTDLSKLGTYKSGSHEIVLNYVFSYSRKVIGPRQF